MPRLYDYRLYSLEDIEYIKNHYNDMTTQALAKHLQRKPHSLAIKISDLGLHKTVRFLDPKTIKAIIDRESTTDFPLRVIADEFHLSIFQLRKVLQSKGIHHKPKYHGWHQNGYNGFRYKGNKAGKARQQLLHAYKNTCWDCKKTLLPAALCLHHDWTSMPIQVIVLCRDCHKKRHGV